MRLTRRTYLLVYDCLTAIRKRVLRRFGLDLCPQCGSVVDYGHHSEFRCPGFHHTRFLCELPDTLELVGKAMEENATTIQAFSQQVGAGNAVINEINRQLKEDMDRVNQRLDRYNQRLAEAEGHKADRSDLTALVGLVEQCSETVKTMELYIDGKAQAMVDRFTVTRDVVGLVKQQCALVDQRSREAADMARQALAMTTVEKAAEGWTINRLVQGGFVKHRDFCAIGSKQECSCGLSTLLSNS